MSNCENYTHEDIQAACEDMQGMDDEQKLQRMYELLQHLDEEYDTISSVLGEESNTMARDLFKLHNEYFADDLKFVNIINEGNATLFRKAYVLQYMIEDFANDGSVSEDIFNKYDEFEEQRSNYVRDLVDSVNATEMKLYPNPANEYFNISVPYQFNVLTNPDIISIFGIGANIEKPPFDPYVGLPVMQSNDAINYTNPNSSGSTRNMIINLYDMHGKVVDKHEMFVDGSGNIGAHIDTVGLTSGTYIVQYEMPPDYGHDFINASTYGELKKAGLDLQKIFTKKVIVTH